MRRRLIFLAPLAVVAVVLFIALGGTVVKLLWNWLLPPLFGVHEVTFWQALGMLALCRILFGGFGSHKSHRPGRWDRMTPEERDRFRQGIRRRFGFEPPAKESPESRA